MNTLAKKSIDQLTDHIERSSRAIEIYSSMEIEVDDTNFSVEANGRDMFVIFKSFNDLRSFLRTGKDYLTVDDYDHLHELLKVSGLTLYLTNGLPGVAGARAGKIVKWLVRKSLPLAKPVEVKRDN